MPKLLPVDHHRVRLGGRRVSNETLRFFAESAACTQGLFHHVGQQRRFEGHAHAAGYVSYSAVADGLFEEGSGHFHRLPAPDDEVVSEVLGRWPAEF